MFHHTLTCTLYTPFWNKASKQRTGRGGKVTAVTGFEHEPKLPDTFIVFVLRVWP